MSPRREGGAADALLLDLVAELRLPATRADAARRLAQALGAEALVVFTRDDEVDTLLPAPGFPQTLPDGTAWRAFLASCVERGRAVAPLRLHEQDAPRCADGYAWERDAVVVLLGSEPCDHDVRWLRALLPLLASVFRGEQAVARARVQARMAQQSAARSATLAELLGGARAQLEAALREARQSRIALEAANDQMRDQAAEREQANAQLREQAHVLETQAVELETQAEELGVANNALVAARHVAERANHAKTEFLATMSHELRTPLNAIGGYAQLMDMELHGPITAQQHEAIDRIMRSQRHLLGLINDILNLSRIEAGRVEYTITTVPLRDALDDVSGMLVPQLVSRQLAFEVSAPERLPAVRADRDKLQQILLNLLFNATKFTAPGGRVWVEARPAEQTPALAVLRVSDTGCGIAPGKLEMIFEPFTQVRADLARSQTGSGLGLAISRDLARGMGGDLTAESTPDVGSSFLLLLPRGPGVESPANG